jgi:signal transduction histidine kinase
MSDTGSRPAGPVALDQSARGRRSTVGALLFGGFGLTIVLWLAAGVDLAFRYQALDREVGGMMDRFLASEQALGDVRTSVLLGAIDWRDALLDSGEPESVELYLAQLHRYQQVCDTRLAEMERSGDPLGGSDSLMALTREVDDYWASVLPLVTLPPARRATDLRRLLNDRIVPRRESVIRIVARVQSLNRSHLQVQQRRMADVYGRSRNRFLLTGGAALVLSLVVGAFVSAHVGRLERRLRAQLAANAENTSQLHRLSARLVRAQEDERRLIARELHDEVGQALTAVKMQLALARRSVPDGQAGAIDEARTITDAALQSARQISRLLHPPMLEDTGLAATLDWYLKGFSERTGIPVEFVHSGMEERAAPEVETCLFRVVQEATTNVARHAHATSCRVYLQRLPASVVLTVEDNGAGFEPDAARGREPEGLGLMGIEERVTDARGTFRIESARGRGARIIVELPALAVPREPAGGGAPADADGGPEETGGRP